jgi:hypothetical protein
MDPFSLDHIIIRSSARASSAGAPSTLRVSRQDLCRKSRRRPPEALTQSTRARQYQAPTNVSTPRSSLPLGQQLLSALLFTLPLRCQRTRTLEVWGLEPQTYGLQSHRSSH